MSRAKLVWLTQLNLNGLAEQQKERLAQGFQDSAPLLVGTVRQSVSVS